MQDKIEKIGKSVIQHGKFNNRIYLLKSDPNESEVVIRELDELARVKGYTKIFTKIDSAALPLFIVKGYVIEAYVPEFYHGGADCLMVSKFFDRERGRVPLEALERFRSLLFAAGKPGIKTNSSRADFSPCSLAETDVASIAGVFKRVFETYPFPVHDPDYILKTMQTNQARYFGIREGQKLIGVSTAETDLENGNAEMTDFAVLPEYRGKRMAFYLLVYMEKEMKNSGIKTAYTIARLNEPGMNKTFLKAGYKYTGTLVNNTNIGGSIESMNIFYKKL